jgi:hypothetical protein
LRNTTPIYLGCQNINSYFPDNVICLSGNVDKDIELLKSICSEPNKYVKQIDGKKNNGYCECEECYTKMDVTKSAYCLKVKKYLNIFYKNRIFMYHKNI